MSGLPADFFPYVERNEKVLIDKLTKAVSFDSISAVLTEPGRARVIAMADWLIEQLHEVGVKHEDLKRVDLGKQPGTNPPLNLPPVVLARVGKDPKKKTVLVYCHYDVHPAQQKDGWDTEPFKLTHKGDKLVGRGTTDDKGPIIGWLTVLKYHQEKQKELPVNLRFCFGGLEESGDAGALDKLVQKEGKGPDGWFYGVNAVALAGTWWLGTTKPTLTYGVRGIAYFKVTVSGPTQDLHSGMFGGMIYEPLTELVYLLSNIVDAHGHILVDDVTRKVPTPQDRERILYEHLDYSIDDIDAAIGAKITLSDTKADVLMGQMRNPSLSIHGIEGAWTGPGPKTVIPGKVTGHFSLRLVPPQNPEEVADQVRRRISHLHNELHTRLGQPNVELVSGARAWVADTNDWHYTAAQKAVQDVYNTSPDLVRVGSSVPGILAFAHEIKDASVVILSMGRGDDNAHSINEKLNVDNFIKGTKFYGAYLYEIAHAPK